jgi:PAS domain S-box-containing protein
MTDHRTPEPDPQPARAHTAITGFEDERLYRLLVESVRDYAIFALDAEGYIVSWNIGAERLKGYTREEIIGQHFSNFYTEEEKGWKPAWELAVAAEQGRVEDEGWRVRKDGSLFWASVVITALRDEAGELVGFAKVTRDLTERRRAEQAALEDARRIAAAEAESRAKSQFLATMSHELRTPLNAIGGYAELLALGLRGPLTAAQHADVERILESERHLLAIINDLLSFSRIEAGQIEYDLAPLPVSGIVRSVMPMVEPQANGRNVAFELAPSPEDARACADEAKLRQILLNLFSNAVKFTPAGGRVRVAWSEEGERVVIRVRDTGVGIPEAQREAVFEPFVQIGRTLSSTHEGTGLGLPISRDLARGMGGDLVVEDTPGAGATLALSLPRAEPGAAPDS